MKNTMIAFLLNMIPFAIIGQVMTPDTVEIELAGTSKVVFTMQDRKDLSQLKHYDFQALFDDILVQLEKRDTIHLQDTPAPATSPSVDDDVTISNSWEDKEDEDFRNDWDDDDDDHDDWHNHFPSSRQFFNGEFGINNYLENGNFPDASQAAYYTVHPWGSWYIGLNAVNRIRFSENFSLEAGLGISWYNFKFDEDNSTITKTIDEISFGPDPRDLDFTKSKLTTSYVNVSLIPIYNTGRESVHDHWHYWRDSEFRIGFGPYIGYRLGSHSKQQYEEENDKHNEKEQDNFYLQNLRYGLRLQIGLHGADFFINYDLNKLFIEDKGPGLNAYSFGVVF